MKRATIWAFFPYNMNISVLMDLYLGPVPIGSNLLFWAKLPIHIFFVINPTTIGISNMNRAIRRNCKTRSSSGVNKDFFPLCKAHFCNLARYFQKAYDNNHKKLNQNTHKASSVLNDSFNRKRKRFFDHPQPPDYWRTRDPKFMPKTYP